MSYLMDTFYVPGTTVLCSLNVPFASNFGIASQVNTCILLRKMKNSEGKSLDQGHTAHKC